MTIQLAPQSVRRAQRRASQPCSRCGHVRRRHYEKGCGGIVHHGSYVSECPCKGYRPSPRRTSGAALRKSRQTQKAAAKAERLAGGRGRAGPGRADVLTADVATEVKSYSSPPIPGYLREWLAKSKQLRQGRGEWRVRWTDANDGMTVEVREA